MTYRHPILVVRGIEALDEETAQGMWDLVRRRGDDLPTEWSFTAICYCQTKHAKAPEDASGCGAYWGMAVVRPVKEAK